MENLNILLELKEEFHRMNLNIERLLERDKVQNKRIDKLENAMQDNNNFVNKFLGALTIIAFFMPIVLKYIT